MSMARPASPAPPGSPSQTRLGLHTCLPSPRPPPPPPPHPHAEESRPFPSLQAAI